MTTNKTEWLQLPQFSKYEINRKLQLRYVDTKKLVERDLGEGFYSDCVWNLEYNSGKKTRLSSLDLLLYFGGLFEFDIDTSDWDDDDEFEFRKTLIRKQQWFRHLKEAEPQPNCNFLTSDELIDGDYYLIGDMHYLVGSDFFYSYDEDEMEIPFASVTTFGTGGDGGFYDQHGRFYTVESGTFGIMKASDIPKEEIEGILKFFADFQKRFPERTEGLGHFVKLENGNVYADELGHIWFGNHEVVIDGNSMWDCINNVGEGPIKGINT